MKKIFLFCFVFCFCFFFENACAYQREMPLSLERAKLKRQYIKIISNGMLSQQQKCSLLSDEFRGSSREEMTRKLNTVLQMNCNMDLIYSKQGL